MFIKFLYLNLVLWPLLFTRQLIQYHTVYAKCVRVIDGDTVTVNYNGKSLKIRLAYIDAPEIKQNSLDGIAVGKMSYQFLKKLIEDKLVKIILMGKDFFGRWIGLIYLNEELINIKIVESGFALIYSKAKFIKKAHKDNILIAYYKAKVRGVGMWSTLGILNPKYFRKKRPIKGPINNYKKEEKVTK